MKLTDRPEWQALQAHYQATKGKHLRELFAEDQQRAEAFSIHAGDIFVDFSKNRITQETLTLLRQLADATGVVQLRDEMFNGVHINTTEDRAVLHTALRNQSDRPIIDNGQDVMPEVRAVLKQMADFSKAIRSETWKGHTGKPIKSIVNIGIGGSDLGPVMAYEALKSYSQRDLAIHFVSSI